MACHGDFGGIHLTSGKLHNETLVRSILSYNKDRTPEEKIRLMVVNSCMSARLAAMLAEGGLFESSPGSNQGIRLEGIEFVIGHGVKVFDSDAQNFALAFYGTLGNGGNLQSSFFAAMQASRCGKPRVKGLNWEPPQGEDDWNAQAGRCEREGMRQLGCGPQPQPWHINPRTSTLNPQPS